MDQQRAVLRQLVQSVPEAGQRNTDTVPDPLFLPLGRRANVDRHDFSLCDQLRGQRRAEALRCPRQVRATLEARHTALQISRDVVEAYATETERRLVFGPG